VKFPPRVLVCECGDQKREHVITKQFPAGPCTSCPCKSFTPEAVCKCGHGKKAHRKGPCHECGKQQCPAFRKEL